MKALDSTAVDNEREKSQTTQYCLRFFEEFTDRRIELFQAFNHTAMDKVRTGPQPHKTDCVISRRSLPTDQSKMKLSIALRWTRIQKDQTTRYRVCDLKKIADHK